jgi:hypothetical protein
LEYDPKDAEIETVESLENVVIHSSDDNGALLSCEISVMQNFITFENVAKNAFTLIYTLALVFFIIIITFSFKDVVSI